MGLPVFLAICDIVDEGLRGSERSSALIVGKSGHCLLLVCKSVANCDLWGIFKFLYSCTCCLIRIGAMLHSVLFSPRPTQSGSLQGPMIYNVHTSCESHCQQAQTITLLAPLSGQNFRKALLSRKLFIYCTVLNFFGLLHLVQLTSVSVSS